MSDAQSMSDDDIFDSAMADDPVEPTPEVAASEPDSQSPAEPEEPTEDASASEEQSSEDVADSGAEPKTVPLKAVQEERQKRQQAQAELETARQLIAALQTQQGQAPAKPVEAKTFWEDPEGAMAEREWKVRSEMSEQMMQSQHEDYTEARDAFAAAAQQNPAMWQAVKNHPFPAKLVYEQGKAIQEFGDSQSPADYRERIESEVRTKLEAEFQAKEQELKARYAVEGANQVPKTNAGARSVASSVNPIPTDDDIFDAIAGGR